MSGQGDDLLSLDHACSSFRGCQSVTHFFFLIVHHLANAVTTCSPDSSTDGSGLPTSGDQEKDWRSQINPYTSPTITGPSADQAGQMAHVIIRWQ